MLRVLRINSICTLVLTLFVGGAVFAQQLTDLSKSDPWTGPSAEKEKAIEAWATKSLSKPESSSQPKTLSAPEAVAESNSKPAPAALNPFAAQPIQPLAGDRYSQAVSTSAPSLPPTTEKEVVRYDAQDSLNVSLRSESKDSFEESPSSNPLRSSTPATTNSLRQPSREGSTVATPGVSNPPSDAARMAFSAPTQEEPLTQITMEPMATSREGIRAGYNGPHGSTGPTANPN